MADGGLALPAGFLLGCASAAHQVEGGTDNDWSEWARQPGRIRDGSDAAVACDHWHRYPEDLQVLASLGQNAHRFSLEWSRIEPRPGDFDEAALAHYADVVACCRDLGMEPLVTLLHFTLPRWLTERGGVRAPEAPARFARYAAVCAERLGPSVEWWVTINEPNVQALMGYLTGEWPPGKASMPVAFAALRGLLRMHAGAATALRAVAARHERRARVSVAHHVRGLRPARPSSVMDRLACLPVDRLMNRWWPRACRSGRMLPPVGRGEKVAGAAGSLDWLGLNYYCDDTVRFAPRRPSQLFAQRFPDPRRQQSSFGWAIHAGGLTRVLHELWDEFRLPIVVTENGVADEADELRGRFLVEHVTAVARAAAAGVDVRGYLHWTAMDNFEWAEGYTKRFGLFAVDRDTLQRRPKPSAAVFARICAAGGVPADLLDAVPRLTSVASG
ncbi:MAG TPA: glycoside hydrolase family 1 protein [Candidatus Dormibacteraeota bacterium]